MENCFRQENRIRTGAEFQSVMQSKPIRSEFLAIYARHNHLPNSRLGLIVSRRVGSAVKRNRTKRLLREVFRRIKNQFAAPLDVVIRAHPAILSLSYHTLYDEIAGTLQHSGWLQDDTTPGRQEE